MNRTLLPAGLLAAALLTAAMAQPPGGPPDGPEHGPPHHGKHHGPPPEFRDALRRTLDANHDLELDSAEIAGAPAALAKLDENGDGTLDRWELRPQFGPPPGRHDHGGPESRRPGDRRGEGRPRRGEFGGPPDRDDFERRPPREDRDGPPPPPPPRDGERPEGPPPRDDRDDFRRGAGRPGDRPSPERFAERAMSFDADGDGKLDENELRELGESLAERMRAARDRGRPGGPPRGGDGRPDRPPPRPE